MSVTQPAGRNSGAHAEVTIDWEAWRLEFGLPRHELWYAANVFGAIAANSASGSVPLSAELLLELAEPSSLPTSRQMFDAYLERGELAAASALLTTAAENDDPEVLRRALAERRDELDLELNRQEASATARHSRLVALGQRRSDDPDLKRVLQEVADDRASGRVGPALLRLTRYALDLDRELQELHARLVDEAATLRFQSDSIPPALREAVLRRLQRADRHLEHGDDDLASESLRQTRALIETGIETSPAGESESLDAYRLREPFPEGVRARAIVDWVRRGDVPNVPHWPSVVRSWLPATWQHAEGTDDGIRNDAVYIAIKNLAAARRSTPTASSSDWPFFLKDFFDLLGRRGQEPKRLHEESGLTRQIGNTKVGFWHGECDPTLALPGTFLDPIRIGSRGLPVLIWHRPNEQRRPQPGSLEYHIHRLGLRDRPFLILADDIVTPEDRATIKRVTAGSGAVLDEADLLRIILCASDLPPNRDQTRARQLHFAALVSSQLSPSHASPFREQGPALGQMFFGRTEVLRQLLDPMGPTILFGGRRLGKSSILHQVRTTFIERDPEHKVAIYDDSIAAGSSHEALLRIVQTIARELVEHRPLVGGQVRPAPFRGAMPVPMSVPEFVDGLRTLLRTFPDHRVLLLLDEADSLCELLDVPDSPQVPEVQRLGWLLRSVVLESPGRFDVRFAGFQEIQRAARSDSGPFFNFRPGTASLPLTVFEREEAVDLLVSTLRGLNVEFAETTLVERVLDFTGRHPALLQEFGRRLYEQVRNRRTGPPWTVQADDIDAVMLNRDYRRSVVDTIHLNVSRHTRPQRVLALLLYVWVQQMLAPEEGAPPREARTARDLHDLVGRMLGAEAQALLDVATIDLYLRDLVVLGVLEPRGHAYVFAYRSFATLLFHDYFAGELDRQTLETAWDRIRRDVEATRRAWLPTADGHSVSPLARDAHDRLLATWGPVLLLGAAGTGRELALDWLMHRSQASRGSGQARSVAVRALAPTSQGLRDGLVSGLGLGRVSSWRDFLQAGRNMAEQLVLDSTPVTLGFDPIDELLESDEAPFIIDQEPPVDGHDDVFGLLHDISEKAPDRLRIVMPAGLAGARLWVENADSLGARLAWFRTERLTEPEILAWLEAARVHVPNDEVQARIWAVTRGDWRLLTAFATWIRRRQPLGEIVTNREQIDAFRAILGDPERRANDLPGLVELLTHADFAGLRTMVRAASLLGMSHDAIENWRTACHEILEPGDDVTRGWTPTRWDSEIRALALLGEIGEERRLGSGGPVATYVVDVSDPWLSLLAT